MISAFGIDHGDDVAKAFDKKKAGTTAAVGGAGMYAAGRGLQRAGARKATDAVLRPLGSLKGFAEMLDDGGVKMERNANRGLKMMKLGRNMGAAGLVTGTAGLGAAGIAALKNRKKKSS